MICKDKVFANFSQKRASVIIAHLTLFFLYLLSTQRRFKNLPICSRSFKNSTLETAVFINKHLAYRKCLYLKNLFYYETIGIFFMGRQICRQTFKYALVYLSSQTFTFQKNLDVGLLK